MKKILLAFLFLICIIPIDAKKIKETEHLVKIETSMGDITIKLYNDIPRHRDNFIQLVKKGFYNGLLFHRVINNFMIQTGDPQSKEAKRGDLLGNGSLNYTIAPEIDVPNHYHQTGAVAMAREGDEVNPERYSSGCQFYIVCSKKLSYKQIKQAQERVSEATDGEVRMDNEMINTYMTKGGAPHLDGQYTVFGEVIEGLDIVKQIEQVSTDINNRPNTDIRIIKATLIR